MTTLPIACTLTPGDYADRLTWISRLNRESLQSHRQEGLTLELAYSPAIGNQVRDLVEREAECCTFLHFTITETAEAVHLRIEAPPDARDSATALFAPFLEGASGVLSDSVSDSVENPVGGCVGESCGCKSRTEPTSVTAAFEPQNSSRKATSGINRIAGTAAVTSATAAVACAVCCVLPFAFPAVALTGVGAVFAAFSHVYRWASYAAIIAVVLSWALVGLQSKRSKKRPSPATLRVMAAATILLSIALSWPFMEPHVIAQVTAMVRS